MYSVIYYRGLMSELLENKVVLVPSSDAKCFAIFCRIKGVNPCGGELVQNNGEFSQYFYL